MMRQWGEAPSCRARQNQKFEKWILLSILTLFCGRVFTIVQPYEGREGKWMIPRWSVYSTDRSPNFSCNDISHIPAITRWIILKVHLPCNLEQPSDPLKRVARYVCQCLVEQQQPHPRLNANISAVHGVIGENLSPIIEVSDAVYIPQSNPRMV